MKQMLMTFIAYEIFYAMMILQLYRFLSLAPSVSLIKVIIFMK